MSGLTEPDPSVRPAWRRRLVFFSVGIGASAGAGVWAWLSGAPEVAVLGGLLAAGLVQRLVEEAVRPVNALAASIETGQADWTTLDIPSRTSGVARELSESLRKTLTVRAEHDRDRDARLIAAESLVRHADVALITYEVSGRVLGMNLSARRLLGVGRLRALADLDEAFDPLRHVLTSLGVGDHRLVEGTRDGKPYAIAVRGTSYVLAGRLVTAAALVEVGPTLEDREAEAWSRLARVLTHEIANSAGPISSLTETASRRLERGDLDGARAALETVGRRAEGLVQFVESYRAVARVPRPEREEVDLILLARDVAALLLEGEVDHAVVPTSKDVIGRADKGLVEQATVNLVQNAVHAVREVSGGRVEIQVGYGPDGHPSISVQDNGPGIPPDALGRVFVPFYTTREGGSGIGLALCRQIARVHGGRITVTSTPGQTRFTLTL